MEEQEQVQNQHSNNIIGIGVEREIYSKPYFSYHYAYKKLIRSPYSFAKKSKLEGIESSIFPYFKDINFNIMFLNISSKGNYVNFSFNQLGEDVSSLGIIPLGKANSFSIKLSDLGKENIPHREIYPEPSLEDFDISKSNLNLITRIISDFSPQFFCIGFDADKSLNFNEIHLEVYPNDDFEGAKHFINTLRQYGISNISSFEKYILNLKKFSHLKFKIKDAEIKNIKYYRSINVILPNFYYE